MNTEVTPTPSAVTVKEAQSQLEKLQNWFIQKVAPQKKVYPNQYSAWLRELSSIREQLTKTGNIRVALIGSTGAGKSTFLNAVLGQQVLPVGVMEPCTAVVTVVRHQEATGYSVSIDFATAQEWRSEIDAFIGTLAPGDFDDDSTSKQIVHAYRKKVEAL